jgi:hypothetical protein
MKLAFSDDFKLVDIDCQCSSVFAYTPLSRTQRRPVAYPLSCAVERVPVCRIFWY